MRELRVSSDRVSWFLDAWAIESDGGGGSRVWCITGVCDDWQLELVSGLVRLQCRCLVRVSGVKGW